MIILLKNEMNIPVITSKVTRNIDYTDNFEFAVTPDVELELEEVVRVKSNLVNQDYRIYEITSDGFEKRIFAKSVAFDCKDIILDIPEADTNGVSLWRFIARLNVYLQEKDTVFRIELDADNSKTVNVNARRVSLYNLLFDEEEGLCALYNLQVKFDNRVITLMDHEREGKNTEILFHENKNIATLDYNTNKKDLVTRLYIAATYKPSEEEKKRLKEEEKRKKEEEKKKTTTTTTPVKESLDDIAYKVIMGRYGNGRPRVDKLTKEGHDAKAVQRRVNELLRTGAWKNLSKTQKAEANKTETDISDKTDGIEVDTTTTPEEEKDIVFYAVYTSPIANNYSRIYEGVLEFDSEEISTQEKLEEWCRNNLFNENDTRDIPLTTYSFEPAKEDYRVDLYDKAMVKYTRIGINKVVKCVEYEYDPQNDKYYVINFGALRTNPRAEAMKDMRSHVSSSTKSAVKKISDARAEFERQLELDRLAFKLDFETEKAKKEADIEAGIQEAKDKAKEFQNVLREEIQEDLDEVRDDLEELKGNLTTAKEDLSNAKTELEELNNTLNDKIDDSVREILKKDSDELIKNSEAAINNLINNKVNAIEIPDVNSIVDSKIEELNLDEEMRKKVDSIFDSVTAEEANYVKDSFFMTDVHKEITYSSDYNSIFRNKTVTLSFDVEAKDNVGGRAVFSPYIQFADNTYMQLDNRISSKDFKGRSVMTYTVPDKEIVAIYYNRIEVHQGSGGSVLAGNPRISINDDNSDGIHEWYPNKNDKNKAQNLMLSNFSKFNENGYKTQELKVDVDGIKSTVKKIDDRFDANGKLIGLSDIETKVNQTAGKTEEAHRKLDANFNADGTVKDRSSLATTITNSVNGISTKIDKVTEKFNDDGSLKEFKNFTNKLGETAEGTKQVLDSVKRYINKDGTIKDTLNTHIENKTSEVFEREISKAERGIITKANIREEATGVMREYIQKVDSLKLGARNYILNSNECTEEKVKYYDLSTNDFSIFRGKTLIISADAETINVSGSYNGRSRTGIEAEISFTDNTTLWNLQAFAPSANFKGRISEKYTLPNKEIRRIRIYVMNQWATGISRICRPMLEIATVESDYQPAHEDMSNKFATYIAGVDLKLSELTDTTNDNKTAISKVVQTAKEISNQISFDNNGNVKFREVKLNNEGNVISTKDKLLDDTTIANIFKQDSEGTRQLTEKILKDGTKVAASIVNTGEAINMISDNVRVTANSENLLRTEAERNFTISNTRDKYATIFYKNEGADKLKAGDEFLISGEIIGNNSHSSTVGIAADTNAGTKWWGVTLVDANQTGKKTATLKLPTEVDNLTISRYRVYTNIHAFSNHGSRTFKNLSVIKKKDASFIVDGTIKANHLATNSITSDKIVGNSITGDKIVGNTITGDKIVGNTITGDKIVGNTITGDKIRANTITGGHINAGSINAAHIGAKAITAEKIATNAIKADHILADSALFEKLKVNDIVASHIESLSLTANKITGGVLMAANGATYFDLDRSNLVFNADSTIEFKNGNNMLYRKKRYTLNGQNRDVTAFLKFQDDEYKGVYTVLGVDSHGGGNDYVGGEFAGVRIIRTNSHNNPKIDKIQMVADSVHFSTEQDMKKEFLRINYNVRDNLKGKRVDLMKFISYAVDYMKMESWKYTSDEWK